MNYAIVLASNDYFKMNMVGCSFPLLGKPIIEYLVDSLEQTAVDKILCVAGEKKGDSSFGLTEKVKYIFREEINMNLFSGTGSENDYTIFIPGNMPFVDQALLEKIVNEHKAKKNDLTLGTIQKENFEGFVGIKHNRDEKIKLFYKEDCDQENLCKYESFTGIFCIKNSLLTKVLEPLKDHSLLDVLNPLIDEKKIGLFTIDDVNKVYQITDLVSLSCVEEELRKSIIKKHMLNGVCIINPQTTMISCDTKIEAGTILHPGCNILGKTYIGKNCVIGPNTELRNAILEAEVNCVHSIVFDSKISRNAYVGPFAHIRTNSVIGIGDRIGNFVEIKNSSLGTRTDVAHLTYIGDTCCGDYVNWGCGCVTVNYDGQNKNKTIVGNHSFIGCNTNLIAPIVIGDYSFIAAGSTIDTDVLAGDFAIARARQINKKDYAKKYNSK